MKIVINKEDISIKRYSKGKGGQRQNKSNPFITITHIPTGIHSTCTEYRSYTKNFERALKELVKKLKNHYIKIQHEENVNKWKSDEIVRTYNYKRGTAKCNKTGKIVPIYGDYLLSPDDLDELHELNLLMDREI